MRRLGAFALAIAALVAAEGPARAACDTGEKVDRTTVEDARKKVQAAGYAQVRGLRKSCDSYWHGTATRDGRTVNVVVTPQGQVMTEGN